MSTVTNPPITDATPTKLTLKAQLGLLGLAAAAGAAWFSIKADTATNTGDITNLKADNQELRLEQRQQREILIRIDENVKQLRRDTRPR